MKTRKHSIFIFALPLVIFTSNVICKPLETLDEENSSNEEKATAKSPGLISNIPKTTEDAAVGFLKKLINTGYVSSQIALRRIEKANEKRKDLEDRIEQFLESIPSYSGKIPILDDLPKLS